MKSPAVPQSPHAAHTRRNIRRDPAWRPARLFTARELPARDRNWLLDDGSLTGRLMGLGCGPFSVQRLRQDWAVPLPSERTLLDLPPRQLAIVREVALQLAGESVVFARSVLPVSSLQGRLAHLRRLQNRPLGAILFGEPGMRRSPFELALLPGDSDYLPTALHQAGPAWARRSRFRLCGHSLLVSEVFLQPFTPWQAPLPVHRSQRGKVVPSGDSQNSNSSDSRNV